MTVSVVALIAAFNEADVIAHVVRDLIEQGVGVYLMDDGSSDGTVAAVEPFVGRGVLRIERLGEQGSTRECFEWERILRRKAQIAAELDADWFIHHDADEFRESPWRGVPLATALEYVDRLGFNAVDAVSLDFWPTDNRFTPGTDVREALTHYTPAARHDRRQVRMWKKQAAPVDLASSGGHDVQFPGRRVFPVPFVLRHYPLRSQAHAEQKVFRERITRFRPAERERGWHVQYDAVGDGASFIRDAATLTRYDPDEVRARLVLEHPRIGELEEELLSSREALQHAHTAERAAHAAEREAHQRTRDAFEQELERERTTHLADNRRHLDEIATARRDFDRRSKEVADYDRSLTDALRRIAAVESSWSWRLTGPIRKVLGWFTGAKS